MNTFKHEMADKIDELSKRCAEMNNEEQKIK